MSDLQIVSKVRADGVVQRYWVAVDKDKVGEKIKEADLLPMSDRDVLEKINPDALEALEEGDLPAGFIVGEDTAAFAFVARDKGVNNADIQFVIPTEMLPDVCRGNTFVDSADGVWKIQRERDGSYTIKAQDDRTKEWETVANNISEQAISGAMDAAANMQAEAIGEREQRGLDPDEVLYAPSLIMGKRTNEKGKEYYTHSSFFVSGRPKVVDYEAETVVMPPVSPEQSGEGEYHDEDFADPDSETREWPKVDGKPVPPETLDQPDSVEPPVEYNHSGFGERYGSVGGFVSPGRYYDYDVGNADINPEGRAYWIDGYDAGDFVRACSKRMFSRGYLRDFTITEAPPGYPGEYILNGVNVSSPEQQHIVDVLCREAHYKELYRRASKDPGMSTEDFLSLRRAYMDARRESQEVNRALSGAVRERQWQKFEAKHPVTGAAVGSTVMGAKLALMASRKYLDKKRAKQKEREAKFQRMRRARLERQMSPQRGVGGLLRRFIIGGLKFRFMERIWGRRH